MSDPEVIVVGSGPVGTSIAWWLCQRGHRVLVLERGPDVPYPHSPQFEARVVHQTDDPRFHAAPGLKGITTSGDYRFDLDRERSAVVGGSGTHWEGIALRMLPVDFRTQSRHGYGVDWPVDYAALEPWYGRAEDLLSISGTAADDPFGPPRSSPYPLPAFDLAADDRLLARRLRAAGITLHTTPQARTRHPRDGRPACANYGTCAVCPIGARYSPNHHLRQAAQTGRLDLRPETTVRRVLPGGRGRRPAVVVRAREDRQDRELVARAVVVAGGAIESTRLLLLSSGPGHPDGLGNASGHLGRHFALHHVWWNDLLYDELLYPGRFGGWTGQSLQFLDAPTRGRHGALKVVFSSRAVVHELRAWGSADEVWSQLERRRRTRRLLLVGEPETGPRKRLQLSRRRDCFGDPFAHLHYELSDFDRATFAFAREVHDRFVAATGAQAAPLPQDPARFGSGAHHMGGCRMSERVADGVVDPFGAVHGAAGVFVAGGACFAGPSGAVNPTLTMVALALRTAAYLAERVLR